MELGGYKMGFRIFKRKDPICKMKEEKGKGLEKNEIWFCSERCLETYETQKKQNETKKQSCCCH